MMMSSSIDIRMGGQARWLVGACILSALVALPLPAHAQSPSVYLWGVRTGCQFDPLAADVALSRIRGVGRTIVALNVPATPEARSCSARSCGNIISRTAACAGITGALIGAEIDEVPATGGIVTRIRAWRHDLGAGAEGAVLQEHLACDRCSARQVQEQVAKTLNRLLDRADGSTPSAANSYLAFPAAECTRSSETGMGAVQPAYCETPMNATCSPEQMALEPSGREALSVAAVAPSRPSARPRGLEWIPIIGTAVGLAATVGFGVANEYVTLNQSNQTVRYVLTPAFWTSAVVTAIMGVTSAALVGDRYRRERRASWGRSTGPEPPALTCSLLSDAAPSGRDQ